MGCHFSTIEIVFREILQYSENVVSVRFRRQFDWRSTAVVGFVRICTVLEQIGDTLFVPFLCRNAQRRGTLFTRVVRNSSIVQQ